jgi:hypothetical protein
VVGGREAIKGQQVRLGLQQQPGDLRHPALQVGDGLGQQPPGLLDRAGAEDRADRGADQLLEVLGTVPKGVT